MNTCLLKKRNQVEGAPAPEKTSLSHFHYGNTNELGAAGQLVTVDPQGAEIGENGDRDGAAGAGVAGEGGGAAGGDVTLTAAEHKRLKSLMSILSICATRPQPG